MVIHWRSKHRVKHTRQAFFVSPSAESIRVDVAPVARPGADTVTIVNRTASATSAISLDAPIGSDTFTFAVFDQQNAQGNELGGAAVQRRIVAGKANTVSATLEGYASTFAIASTDGRFAPVPGSVPAYTVAGEGAYTFTVAPVDVDGNVILSPGVPAVSATSDTAYFQVTAVARKANTFTIQALATVPASAFSRPQLVVSAPGAYGVTATQSYALTQAGLLYAVGGTGASAQIYAYDSLDNQYALPAGGFAGLSVPIAMAYDSVNKRIYVADAATNSILAYDESGSAVSGWTAPAVPGITGIAYSPNQQHIYAASTANGGQILVFDTTGAAVNLNGGFSGLTGPPVGIAYNALFDQQTNAIGVVESGNPGALAVYSDAGVANPSESLATLKDYHTAAAFDPTGIGPGGSGYFLIAGADAGTTTWVVGLVCDRCPRANTVQFLGGNQGHGSILQQPEGGATASDISAPTSVVTNPATGRFYVVNGAGGVPNGGLSGFTTPYTGNTQWPKWIGSEPVTGDSAIIGPPSGLTNFTAAAFTEF
jgi:hypothetical protein